MSVDMAVSRNIPHGSHEHKNPTFPGLGLKTKGHSRNHGL